ncbi:ABC transporter ATP-binding protein [Corynebacterium pacaense]|uniref:ABC transporter ATP-binding protein n=1 Tax=Corynebacterium pacaense TaxID=1816684 RepID=UPI0009BAFD78|nr:ATP-binding cassette domain-containing protein [Corynebacterium pacaense]
MIEFEGISKRYSDGTLAVDDVSFTVEEQSIVVLLGSSGSGKSTLLGMVNRMIEPTRGRVLIDAHPVTDTDPVQLRRSIGYVLQSSGLLPHRSVIDNVATVPRLKGETRAAARAKALHFMEVVGLEASLGNRFPAQLSGGQQQRVGVARALAGESDILLMDEPFGAVDPIVRLDLQREVRRLRRDLAKTIIFVTHDIDEAFALADRIVVLRPGGRIAQIGTPTQLMSEPADEFVSQFIGAGSSRRLRIEGSLVVDATGRILGALEK